MTQYALYLRKSRADLDAEARGEGETLAKHRAALTAYAKKRGLIIAREYAEIVSGDSIAARPQMQQLLDDVKAGLYSGVIVNDVYRLGRGDSIDQEIIKILHQRVFKRDTVVYVFNAAGCAKSQITVCLHRKHQDNHVIIGRQTINRRKRLINKAHHHVTNLIR